MNPLVEIFRDIVYIGLEKFGRYYSTYRAFVIDNKDPEKLQKLQLLIPGISDNKTDKWIPPSNVFYGETWGSQCIPPVGSLVWVVFEKGDPNSPLWVHGYPGEKDVSALPARLTSVNNFWFQTPKGTIIELNDDLETFRVQDAKGNMIESFDGKIKITTSGITQLVKSGSNVEPMLLGNTSVKALKGLISSIQNIIVMTPMGLSSTPLNTLDFQAIADSLDLILSEINYLE